VPPSALMDELDRGWPWARHLRGKRALVPNRDISGLDAE
jgi:hypothetical protein